jgi:Domain of unknown function (DUF1906)
VLRGEVWAAIGTVALLMVAAAWQAGSSGPAVSARQAGPARSAGPARHGGSALLAAAARPTADARTSPATRVVSYHGYEIRVPASWPVYRLAADPSLCVLFNRHAVYLGTPGAAQSCPSRAFGRTEAVLIQPAGQRSELPPSTMVLGARTAAIPADAMTATGATHVLQVEVPEPGVLVTATYGTDQALVHRILADARMSDANGAAVKARATAGARSARTRTSESPTSRLRAAKSRAVRAHPSPGQADPGQADPGQADPGQADPGQADPGQAGELVGQPGSGLGFDTCTVPSTATMRAWLASPYRTVGTYLGGVNWACDYGNFNAAWVGQVAAQGWRFIPIWVGLQAPCTGIGGATTIDPARAAAQGKAEAAAAVKAARGFGYGRGTPVYFDMEGYDSSDTPCVQAVLTFLGGWTQGLHAAGYVSGVYSSASSGIHDLASRYGDKAYPRPDDIWIADWTGDPVLTDPYVPARDWPAHQRLHQYYGAHDETWGGDTVDIDNDVIGGAVAALPGAGATGRPSLLSVPDAVTAARGTTADVRIVIQGAGAPGGPEALVRWQAHAPAGLAVRPAQGRTLVRPGATATVTLAVRPGASLPPGRYDVPVTATSGTQSATETFELASVARPGAALPTAYPIVLYAADRASMLIATATARRLALPSGDVTGSFGTAWTAVSSGDALVLAVGEAATNALYFNPCGWPNPAGIPGGGTPFYYPGEPQQQPIGPDGFELADGSNPVTGALLTSQLAHYALAGTLPDTGEPPAGPVPPAEKCLGAPDVPVP